VGAVEQNRRPATEKGRQVQLVKRGVLRKNSNYFLLNIIHPGAGFQVPGQGFAKRVKAGPAKGIAQFYDPSLKFFVIYPKNYLQSTKKVVV